MGCLRRAGPRWMHCMSLRHAITLSLSLVCNLTISFPINEFLPQFGSRGSLPSEHVPRRWWSATAQAFAVGEFRVYGQIFDEARRGWPFQRQPLRENADGHSSHSWTKSKSSCWPWKKKSPRLMTALVNNARPVFGRELGSVLIVDSIVCDSLSVQIRSQNEA